MALCSLPSVTFCPGDVWGREAFLETLGRAPIAFASVPATPTFVTFTSSTPAMPIAATSACSPIPMFAPPCRCHNRFYSSPLSAAPTFSPFSSSSARDLVVAVACSADSIRWRRASSSGEVKDWSLARDVCGLMDLDKLLLVAELLCVTPPAIHSLACAVSLVIPGASKQFQVSLGNKTFVLQYILLVGAVAFGSLLRWRQWQGICIVNENGASVDLIGRIEKLEEDLRNSIKIIRVMSRQLEKLGIRFRVTRKGLKQSIAEAAALAQKNSQDIRTLAMQGEMLEKELGEMQKVLLAMHEQQQKQLELILTIGKAGRVLDSNDGSLQEGRTETSNSPKKEAKEQRIQPELHAAEGNDKPSTNYNGFLL